LFDSIKEKIADKEIDLNICKDFDGKENDIKMNLIYFLIKRLHLNLNSINFGKLESNSNAHHYAYLMRKDNKNLIKNYISLKLDNLEKYLIK